MAAETAAPRRPAASRPRRSALARRAPWLVMAAVLVLALAVGARNRGEPSRQERARAIAETVRCPSCPGQSVATSDAPAAVAIRRRIERAVAEGRSADEIRAEVAGAFGEDVLLTPASSGLEGLVWVLPVAAVVAAFGGLALAFRRWQQVPAGAPSDEDRRLVERARRRLDADPDDDHGEGGGR